MQETYEEKQVIEPEVIDNLPSVKKLAEIYAKEKPVEVQLNKPKVIHHSVSCSVIALHISAFLSTNDLSMTPQNM